MVVVDIGVVLAIKTHGRLLIKSKMKMLLFKPGLEPCIVQLIISGARGAQDRSHLGSRLPGSSNSEQNSEL